MDRVTDADALIAEARQLLVTSTAGPWGLGQTAAPRLIAALADALEGFTDSGMRYCLTHHGLVDVDQERCDNGDHPLVGEQPDCVFRPLVYRP